MAGIQAGMYHSLWGEMQRESGSQGPTHTKAVWTKLEFFSFLAFVVILSLCTSYLVVKSPNSPKSHWAEAALPRILPVQCWASHFCFICQVRKATCRGHFLLQPQLPQPQYLLSLFISAYPSRTSHTSSSVLEVILQDGRA